MIPDKIAFYEIRSSSYTYVLRLTIKYSREGAPSSVGFDLGGKMKGCVRITVEIPDASNERFAHLKVLEEQKK